MLGFARAGAYHMAEQLKEQNLRLLTTKQEKQSQIERLANTRTDEQSLALFTEEFLANLPDFVQFLYERKKPMFNQVVRLIFQGPRPEQRPARSEATWKAGHQARVRASGRRVRVTWRLFDFDPRFKEWASTTEIKLPDGLNEGEEGPAGSLNTGRVW